LIAGISAPSHASTCAGSRAGGTSAERLHAVLQSELARAVEHGRQRRAVSEQHEHERLQRGPAHRVEHQLELVPRPHVTDEPDGHAALRQLPSRAHGPRCLLRGIAVARRVRAVADHVQSIRTRAGGRQQIGQHPRHGEHGVGAAEHVAFGRRCARGQPQTAEPLHLGHHRRVHFEQQRHAEHTRHVEPGATMQRVTLVDEVRPEAARGLEQHRAAAAVVEHLEHFDAGARQTQPLPEAGAA
jgi:hypothetical protein